LTGRGAADWFLERRVATAGELCERWPGPVRRGQRVVSCCDVTGLALVLGSGQTQSIVESERAERAGVEVARRPAGGGAVVVAPRSQVWIDVWVPRGDELWDDDVVRSARFLGAAWARALGSIGARDLAVHAGPSVVSELSRLVCFAGLGPAEVTAWGSKVVGIAQRRDREGARFFTLAHLRWDPSTLTRLLGLDDARSVTVTSELADVGIGLSELLLHSSRDAPGTISWLVPDGSAAVAGPPALLSAVEEAVIGSLP
jgi:lipoate---protein ligase